MSWNFRKSVKIAPGIKMTVGKRGASINAGPKGYKVSVNSKGDVHRTVSIPGTGLYKRKKIGGVNNESGRNGHTAPLVPRVQNKLNFLKILRIPLWIMAIFFAFVSFSLFADGSIDTGIMSLIFPIGLLVAGLLCK